MRDATGCGTPRGTHEAPVASRILLVTLSSHAVLWVSCLALAALAPTLVRAYAARLARRTKANADTLVRQFLAAGSPETSATPATDDAARGGTGRATERVT
jgi:hypothetical protein